MRLECAPGKERRVQGPALAENENDSKISSFKLHLLLPTNSGRRIPQTPGKPNPSFLLFSLRYDYKTDLSIP
jgi:hypothetical protein